MFNDVDPWMIVVAVVIIGLFVVGAMRNRRK